MIEVKAGAFTYTAPATDLPAHIASLGNLITSPVNQANRFIDYLESAPEVPILDADGRELIRLRKSDFRHVTIMAVTLDPFTELTARAQHLRNIGIQSGSRPLWSVSIDDLRVYADIFENPLIFLHFVEKRMAAAVSSLVDLDDELDHIGMYFVENDYARYAVDLASQGASRLTFNGYRTPITEFYSGKLAGDPVKPPSQDMPARLLEISDFLANHPVRNRAHLVALLLDFDGEFRQSVVSAIQQQLEDASTLHRVRPLSSYGEAAITLFAWSPDALRQHDEAMDYVRAVLAASGEATRPLIELPYDEHKKLISVDWEIVSLKDLSESEIEKYQRAGESLRRRRVAKVETERKIGRNEACPCGSGKKYKRCCLGRVAAN